MVCAVTTARETGLGRRRSHWPAALPLSYDGSTVLAIGLEGHVLLQRRGKSTHIVDIGRGAAASVALAPLGDRAYIAKADGTLLGLDLSLLK